jgi:hypothetical protein
MAQRISSLDFLNETSNKHHIGKHLLDAVGFEVLTAMSTKIAVFWVVAPCSLVEVYRRFRGPCCLHHQGDWSPSTRLHGARTQKTAIYLLDAFPIQNGLKQGNSLSLSLFNFALDYAIKKLQESQKEMELTGTHENNTTQSRIHAHGSSVECSKTALTQRRNALADEYPTEH